MGEQPVGGAATAATANSVVSKQEALKQHKEWLVNFRRDMNLTASTANANDHYLSTAQHLVPTEQSSLTS